MAAAEYEPTLHNIIEQDTLKWIFVGGKGGVGKTTTSSSLAIQLAKVRRSVLLISTDPAHNLSDAFSQKFTHEASLVAGYDNLWAMEIDPDPKKNEKLLNFGSLGGGAMSGALQEIAGAFPGIDEAMSFAEVVRLVRSFDFDVVVFDTAPTGHTLRLLSFPTQLEKGLELMMGMKGKLAGMMKAFTSLMDSQSGDSDEDIIAKIKDTKEAIEAVNIQFKNPDLTTFVCVMIPEFLSLYETERMIQELTRFEIDTHNIVINQVVKPAAGDPPCSLCAARQRMQGKYISQAKELYEDFHILELPLLHEEVRGPAALREFGDKYLCPPKST